MKIKITPVKDNYLLPSGETEFRAPLIATEGSAGFDLYCADDTKVLLPGNKALLRLGFSAELPKGYYVAIVPRSGLAVKKGLIIPNSPGTIDSDYRGEWKVCIKNTGADTAWIRAGDRIAQGILMKHEHPEFEIVETLTETSRGEGGFGSTSV